MVQQWKTCSLRPRSPRRGARTLGMSRIEGRGLPNLSELTSQVAETCWILAALTPEAQPVPPDYSVHKHARGRRLLWRPGEDDCVAGNLVCWRPDPPRTSGTERDNQTSKTQWLV